MGRRRTTGGAFFVRCGAILLSDRRTYVRAEATDAHFNPGFRGDDGGGRLHAAEQRRVPGERHRGVHVHRRARRRAAVRRQRSARPVRVRGRRRGPRRRRWRHGRQRRLRRRRGQWRWWQASGGGGAGGTGGTGGGGGTSSPGGPMVLSFTANATSMLPSQMVTFNAVVTHPAGLDALAGASLTTPDGHATYGALASAAQKGSFTLTLDWNQINQTAMIEFASEDNRVFRAVFYDTAGRTATASVTIALNCQGAPACGGGCYGELEQPAPRTSSRRRRRRRRARPSAPPAAAGGSSTAASTARRSRPTSPPASPSTRAPPATSRAKSATAPRCCRRR